MGAGQSHLTTTDFEFTGTDLQNVVLNNVIPKFTIIEDPTLSDDTNVSAKNDDSLELFTKMYNKFNDELNQHIKMNNLQFNYSTKNKVILKDLDKKIQNLNNTIKNTSENNYRSMRKTMNNMEDTKRLIGNRRILFIAVLFFSILTMALLAILVNRKMQTGNFTKYRDF